MSINLLSFIGKIYPTSSAKQSGKSPGLLASPRASDSCGATLASQPPFPALPPSCRRLRGIQKSVWLLRKAAAQPLSPSTGKAAGAATPTLVVLAVDGGL